MASSTYSKVCQQLYELAMSTEDYSVPSDVTWRAWNIGEVITKHQDLRLNLPTTNRLSEFADFADWFLVATCPSEGG